MKISVSLLSTYLFCPRKLFLQQILSLKEPPKESLVLGSLRHEIYDFINKSDENIVSSIKSKTQYEQLISAYKTFYLKILKEKIIKNKPNLRSVSVDMAEVFKKTWPLISNEAEARANNLFDFIEKYNIYGNELWEKLTPKIVSEHRLESEILQLKGIIDRMEVHTNSYVPIELKTGKMPKEGVWPGHRVQIAAYAMLIEEKYKTNVKKGFVRYLDTNESRSITINPFMKQEIIQLIDEIQKLLKNDVLPKYCENKNKCACCGLRNICYDEAKVEQLLLDFQNQRKNELFF